MWRVVIGNVHFWRGLVQNNLLHYLPLAMAGFIDAPMLTTLHTPPFDPLDEAVAKAAAAQFPFVSVSETITSEWAGLLTISETIPNGVDLSRFSFREHPCNCGFAVWYGRIVPEEGLHLAIDAARLAGIPRFSKPAPPSNARSTATSAIAVRGRTVGTKRKRLRIHTRSPVRLRPHVSKR